MHFTEQHQKTFQNLSCDCNPLHCDPSYSLKTQFSGTVVYGMSSVLYALGIWAKGRRFRLREIKAQFLKPLYPNEEYDLRLTETEQKVTALFYKGTMIQTKIVFSYQDFSEPKPPELNFRSQFSPLSVPRSDGAQVHGPSTFDYRLGDRYLSDMARSFAIEPKQLPWYQLNSLFWASYFIGMEYPGAQALFTKCDIFYEDTDLPNNDLHLFDLKSSFDERFNQVTVTGRGRGIRTLSLLAFKRPDPIHYSINALKSEQLSLASFENKVVLVSGASRGFGSVLAKAFALAGAGVILNYRFAKADALSVGNEISKCGEQCLVIQGDLNNLRDCETMRDQIRDKYGSIDVLVNNAFGVIRALGFLEQSSSEFATFVDRAVRMSGNLLHTLIPLVNRGGLILNISTIFTKQPRAHFAHYIAAKSAVEGLTRALAEEFRFLNFVTVRPPRMLTDQTNAAYSVEECTSPVTVVKTLFDRLHKLSPSCNFHEIDL